MDVYKYKMGLIKKDLIIMQGERNISMIPSPKTAEPEVILNKKEGKLESIDVICTCGRKLHIVCEYKENSAPAEEK